MCQCKKWAWTEWCPIDFFFGDVEAGYIDWEEGWVRRREVRSDRTDISSYQVPQLQCPLSNLRVKHSEKVQSLFSIYDSELIYSETDEIHTNSNLQLNTWNRNHSISTNRHGSFSYIRVKEDLAWHFSVWTSQNRRNLLRANGRKVVTHSLRQKFWRDGLRNWRNSCGQGYGDFTDVILWAVCEDTGLEDHRLKAVQWVFVYVSLYCIFRLSRMRWLD